MCCCCAARVFTAYDDLAAKENELDRLLDVCSSNIATLTKNISSTQYPFSFLIMLLLIIVKQRPVNFLAAFCWLFY